MSLKKWRGEYTNVSSNIQPPLGCANMAASLWDNANRPEQPDQHSEFKANGVNVNGLLLAWKTPLSCAASVAKSLLA